MPAKSKQQFKFMKAVESGSLKVPGLSPSEAAEFTKENKGKKNLIIIEVQTGHYLGEDDIVRLPSKISY